MQRQKRNPWWAILLGMLVVLFVGFAVSVGPYTEYGWYREDVGYTRLFTLEYDVRGWLLAIGLFPTWALLRFGLRPATKLAFVYHEIPGDQMRAVAMLLSGMQKYGDTLLRYIAPIVGFIVGLGLGGEWQTYLLARNGQAVGRHDPIFGLDYGFFIFQLPWLNVLASTIVGLLVLLVVLLLATKLAVTALEKLGGVQARHESLDKAIALFVGLLAVFAAANTILSCLGMESVPGAQFAGVGYAAVWRLHAAELFAGLLLLAGLIALVVRRLAAVALAFAPALLVMVVGVGILPGIIQSVKVEPDKNRVEAPYAARAIDATRWAYGIDTVDVRNMDTAPEPSPREVADAATTFQNMRLWDPEVFREAMEQLQTFKPYYTFNDVDVDRYELPNASGGTSQRTVMLTPRDIELSGLASASQSWVNTKLVYTHGYGVTLAPVNEANSLGQPDTLVGDIPLRTIADLPLERPQIYFSDFSKEEEDPYTIVNTDVDEFDHPTQNGDAMTRWKGTRGIHVNGLFDRLAYAMALGDERLLLTGNLKPGSRLLLHRGVLDRSKRLYPFLKFDGDPYIVILAHRLVWLIDGYTTTDQVPYSFQTRFQDDSVNYVRNSVKICVDAYTGETVAYAIDPSDPILATWRRIYPGLVHDLSDAPAELIAHFRYPEGLYELQSQVLCTYHVTDPQQFLSNVDAWSVPNERGPGGEREVEKPYYLQMRLPDAPSDEFLLIRGFTPFTRDNLAGWLAAHCDAASYGKLTLYLFAKGVIVPGPAQVENLFVQDPEIAAVNRQLNNDQSEIVVGNLLVVPVGKSVVYAESLFLRGRTGIKGIPELRKVILAVKDRIAIGGTYQEAFEKLFGGKSVAPPSPTQTETGKAQHASTPHETAAETIRKASQLLDAADAALRRGDFASFGRLEKQARDSLRSSPGP